MPFVPKTLTLAKYNYNPDNDFNPANHLNSFLNSLFDPWPGPFAWAPGNLFRADLVDLIKAEEADGNAVSPKCWLIDDATVTLLVDILEGYWKGIPVLDNPSPRVIQKDEDFINLVRNYIDNNDLQMRVPGFKCTKKQDNEPSTYELVEARVYSFKKDDGLWDSAVVRRFLELLLAGAHFVVVHSAADVGKVEMPSFFRNFSGLQGTGYTGHSHYAAKLAAAGVNYPSLNLIRDEGETLDGIKEDKDAVLLPVVLCDTTTSVLKDYNSFFQMEGWRPGKNMYGLWKYEYRNEVLAAGYRHGADFATHKKTLWNISTYGASLFSEKRGAPIFLAPKAWMEKGTHLYAGFDGPKAGHGWFRDDLVTGLPEGAKKVVKQDVYKEPNKEDL